VILAACKGLPSASLLRLHLQSLCLMAELDLSFLTARVSLSPPLCLGVVYARPQLSSHIAFASCYSFLRFRNLIEVYCQNHRQRIRPSQSSRFLRLNKELKAKAYSPWQVGEPGLTAKCFATNRLMSSYLQIKT
jgi:hypothetical protein